MSKRLIEVDWPFTTWCLFVILLAVVFNPWWLLLLGIRWRGRSS